MAIDAIALHEVALTHVPLRPIKDTSIWIAILSHTKNDLSAVHGEADFVWAKCHERITVRTLQYHYFARFPLEDFEFRHEGKFKSYFPQEHLQVKDLAQRDGFDDSLVVLRALEREQVDEVRALDKEKAVERKTLQEITPNSQTVSVIEISDDESDVTDIATAHHGEQAFCSPGVNNLPVSSISELTEDSDREHWQNTEDVNAKKRPASSSTISNNIVSEDDEHTPVTKKVKFSEDPPEIIENKLLENIVGESATTDVANKNDIPQDLNDFARTVSSPQHNDPLSDEEMFSQFTHCMSPASTDHVEPNETRLHAAHESTITGQWGTCEVPTCRKHLMLKPWTEYGPRGGPLCTQCSRTYVERYGDEEGNALALFEAAVKENYYSKLERKQQGYAQNMTDDDAPIDHPEPLGSELMVDLTQSINGIETQNDDEGEKATRRNHKTAGINGTSSPTQDTSNDQQDGISTFPQTGSQYLAQCYGLPSSPRIPSVPEDMQINGLYSPIPISTFPLDEQFPPTDHLTSPVGRASEAIAFPPSPILHTFASASPSPTHSTNGTYEQDTPNISAHFHPINLYLQPISPAETETDSTGTESRSQSSQSDDGNAAVEEVPSETSSSDEDAFAAGVVQADVAQDTSPDEDYEAAGIDSE